MTFSELSPSELSLEPIRADALILLQSEEIVLHLEFQTQPKSDIPFRMIDYRLRVYRRFPQKQMRQFVIYLQPTSSNLVQQNVFTLEKTRHEFEVIPLWQQPTSIFLQSTGLLPFAVLSQTDNSTQVLRQVAQEIDKISDPRVQSNVAASTAVLAGLVLKQEVIQRILRRELMQESVIYQEIIAEGEAKGRAEGSQEKAKQIAKNLLNEGMEIELIARVTGLSVEQVEQLQTEQDNNQAK